MSKDPPFGRREVIARRLDDGYTLVAASLAAEFSVSEDAIRRDLRALAAEGRCRRVYGGALPLSSTSGSIKKRIGENREAKRALARAAIKLIEPGELVFLDCGSTNLALAEQLSKVERITIATNSVAIASVMLSREIPLILIGGCVDENIGGAVDASAMQAVKNLYFDRCFLGACAVSTAAGIAALDANDAAFKRTLLDASSETIVLSTKDKLETRARHRIASIDRISSIVVEHGVDETVLEELRRAGPRVISADPENDVLY
ncbi:DeoR/GlpR family DNA-binding transcription regulator [Rhizobium sp. RCAM05973]|uniref:DeoR/GlpR family DNA-binding transcription regulator n=1 Tax=Rhizobium sp. RCAM05973 TaxID=2994066 RepID=UPI0022EBFBEF|nr:DeoR/GlpR family DNA-binding transcription regulator [Rhizobium sp. RCAM05973]